MLSRSGVSCTLRTAMCHPNIKMCHHRERARELQARTFVFSCVREKDASAVITDSAEVIYDRRLLVHDGYQLIEAREPTAATCAKQDTASTVLSHLLEKLSGEGVCITRWSKQCAPRPLWPRAGCVRCVHSEIRGGCRV